jgi:hypothetical protein
MTVVQDSADIDIAAMAAGDGGSQGLIRIDDDGKEVGPWVIHCRFVYPGQQYGKGVFLSGALQQPFCFVRVREGRGRSVHTWDYQREYYILRDLVIPSSANGIDVSINVPDGLTGPFAQCRFRAWVSRGPAVSHEWSGRLFVAQNLAGLQTLINVDGFDASIPRGATSFWTTVPTVGDTGAPIGPFPTPVDVYQLDAYGATLQVNRVDVATKPREFIALSPLARFVGAIDPAGVVVTGTLPIAWSIHA